MADPNTPPPKPPAPNPWLQNMEALARKVYDEGLRLYGGPPWEEADTEPTLRAMEVAFAMSRLHGAMQHQAMAHQLKGVTETLFAGHGPKPGGN